MVRWRKLRPLVLVLCLIGAALMFWFFPRALPEIGPARSVGRVELWTGESRQDVTGQVDAGALLEGLDGYSCYLDIRTGAYELARYPLEIALWSGEGGQTGAGEVRYLVAGAEGAFLYSPDSSFVWRVYEGTKLWEELSQLISL